MKKFLVVGLSFVVLLVSGQLAFSDEPDPQNAGHPLRVAAYILHPIGFVLYHGIFRPAHAIVSAPGLRDVFGHKEDIFSEPAWEAAPAAPVCPAPPVAPEARPEPEAKPEKAPEPSVKTPEVKQPEPSAEPSPPGMEGQPSPQEQTEPSNQPDPQTSKVKYNFRPRRPYALK